MSGILLASSRDGQVGHGFLPNAWQVLTSHCHEVLTQTEFQLLEESGEYLQYLNHRVTKISGIHKDLLLLCSPAESTSPHQEE